MTSQVFTMTSQVLYNDRSSHMAYCKGLTIHCGSLKSVIKSVVFIISSPEPKAQIELL